jgi:hypothetical protein
MQCRKALAAYLCVLVSLDLGTSANFAIDRRLGIVVDKPDITMVPRPRHVYRWISLPHRAFFFKKNLARHSSFVCQQILNEIGKTFLVLHAREADIGQAFESSKLLESSLSTCGLSQIRSDLIKYENIATTPTSLIEDIRIILCLLEGYTQSAPNVVHYGIQEIRTLAEELYRQCIDLQH